DQGILVAVGQGEDVTFLHAEVFARLEGHALATMGERDAMPREELRSRLPHALAPRTFDAVVTALVRRGAVEAERDTVRRASRQATAPLDPLDAALVDRFRTWGRTPPRPADVAREVGAPAPAVRAALDRLLTRGDLVKIKPDLYLEA